MSVLTEIERWQFRYFDAALLDYFSGQPNRFKVTKNPLDVEVVGDETGSHWQVRLDLRMHADGTDILVPYLGDLGELPATELHRWQEFEVADPSLLPLEKDARFIAAYRQNYEGEFVDWPPPEGEPTNG